MLAALFASACAGEGEGRPDSELGDLVISPTRPTPEVSVDEASSSAEALLSAVRLPHSWVGEQLGAHVVRGTSSVRVTEGDTVVEELQDTLYLELDGEDRFHLRLDNSKEYGRHAIFDGTELYLRPRFGRYHVRAPQSETEASDIRDEVFAGASDYLDLVATRLEVSDKGASTRGGRAVREIVMKLAPTERDAPPETLSQRTWRNTIEVKSISGVVALDAASGVPLHLELEGRIAFERDTRRFHMTVTVERDITEIAHTRPIALPEQELIMRIPARHRELDERESLLKSIAPPARKAPTPSNRSGVQ